MFLKIANRFLSVSREHINVYTLITRNSQKQRIAKVIVGFLEGIRLKKTVNKPVVMISKCGQSILKLAGVTHFRKK